jgi:segregation and condensation protein A
VSEQITGHMTDEEFEGEATPQTPASGDVLIVDIAGFEGPLDVLLMLARTQKVDLRNISILELVEQYLRFIHEARRLRLELAAEYLVMAAWLAYLKSRLLLPPEEDEEQPSAEELAARLQIRLQRLNAMREAGARLLARDRLGRDVFARGAPEGVKRIKHATYDVTLYELLKAYSAFSQRGKHVPLTILRRKVFSLEEAVERLSRLIGTAIDWTTLEAFLPESNEEAAPRRSAVASLFAAALELARQGKADIQQSEHFSPIFLKGRHEQ